MALDKVGAIDKEEMLPHVLKAALDRDKVEDKDKEETGGRNEG